MRKVVKFGGSSLADAEQFKKVKNIVLSDEKKQIYRCKYCEEKFDTHSFM